MKKWTMSQLRRSWKVARHHRDRRPYRPSLEGLESRVTPANINITAFHYDPFIQGQDTQETNLSPLTVNANNFGKLASLPVDGYTYAQPVYMHNLMISGMPHDVAFVATEHDSLYAFDIVKNPTSGAVTLSQLWKRSFIDPTNGITSVPQPDIISGDIQPEIGITGGPVIDPATNVLYLVAKTKEVRGDGNHWVQKIYAIDLTSATGANKVAPYTIGDTHTSATFANETTAIMVPGQGAETSGGANPMVPFSALKENNRPSLQLLNGRVYVAWASHGDNGPYHGWVVGFNETTLMPEKIFCTSPNGGLSGIWQSEGAVSTDGRYLYFAVGNGGGAAGFPAFDPAHGNYSESVLKIDTQATGVMMPVADYFTPFNWQNLDSADADLGSGGVMLLPDSVGGNGHTHLMVETGKDGHIYLIDRDNMGQFHAGTNMIVQDVVAGPGGVWGNPAFYQESATTGLIFYHGSGSDSRVFRVMGGQIQQVSGNFIAYRSNQNFGFPGAQPVITANGVNSPTSAVIWELQTDNYGSQGPATLHAYSLPSTATGTLTELYNSNQSGARDQLSASVKFTSAIVTNGLVFVAQGGGPAAGNPASGTFNVFGTFPPPTMAPAAPTNLAATGLSSTQIQLNWTNPPPNQGAQATAVNVFRSAGDNMHYGTTPVATVAGSATTYTDTVSDPNQTYFYKVQASNVVGNSPFSNEVSATPFVQPVLSLGNVASNAVPLSWTRPPVANNRYDVLRSTSANFTNPMTVASGLSTNTTTFTDTSVAANPGTYYYQIKAYSTAGATPFALSNIVGVKVGPNAGVINYGPPNGFPQPPNPAPFDVRANGTAQFAESTARLTNATNQTGSAFSASQENILNWTTTFNVRLHEGTQPNYANGFTFTIQAIGPNALGQGQSGLGYQGITNSVTIKFETTTGAAENGTGGSTGLFYAGDVPTTPNPMHPGEVNLPLNAATDHVNLMSQSTKTITLSYAYNAANPSASVLHEVIVDNGPGQGMYTHDYMVDIPSLLGIATAGNTIAYVGFTASTGSNGNWELQDILNWVFTPTGPAAPNHLTVVSGTTTNTLNWRTTSADDQGYYVERSTNINGPFSRITTLGAGVTTYTDTGLTNPQQYYYRVQQFNHNGSGGSELDSGYSNVATGAVVSVNFTSFPNGTGFTTNTGSPPVRVFPGTPSVLRLTDGQNGETSTAWYNIVIGSGAFTTTFTLKDVPGGGAADSVSFVIQNDPRGTAALGGGGGDGGYSGIANSMAIKFDLYTHGSHNSSTGLFTNGQSPAGFPAQDVIMGPSPIDLRTGDPMRITLTYDGGTGLTEMVQDTVTGMTFSHTYVMPMTLAQLLGGNTGYVGFTGATGGENATQDIQSWTGAFAQAPPQVSRFVVSATPNSITAGQSTSITVTAMDQNGNVFSGYTGTVHISSTDPQAGLPADYMFTTADHGMHVFSGAMAATLKTAGNQTVTVTDTAKNSVTGNTLVAVSPAAITALSVKGFPVIVARSAPANFTVAAVDAYGNTNPSYLGTVHLMSSDNAATFANGDGTPLTGNNYTFTATDGGVHTFRATLNTVGTQSITATDSVNHFTGTEAGINVQQAGATAIDFSNGFANHGNLTANGSTSFPNGTTVARLTDAQNSEGASLYYNTLVGTGPFSTTFTFVMKAGSNPIADGLTFLIQADPRGVAALGQGGGALGYGTDANDGQLPAIQHSVAIKFDAYKGFNTADGNHSSTGLYVNGFRPNNPGSGTVPPGAVPVDLAGSGIDFNASAQLTTPHTFTATLIYDGTTLLETIKDNTSNVTFMHSYTVNITQVVGGTSAYVGFTAGTGGLNAFIDVQSWTGSFQQFGQVNVTFTDFANHGTLTANTSPQSPPVNVFPTTTVSPNFPNFNTHTGFVTNGNATFTGTPTVLRLTDGGTGQAASAWYTSAVLAGNFTTTFILQDQPTIGAADSLSFVMQADPRGSAALGGGGGAGGYGGIVNSFAIKFDLYDHGDHKASTGLFTGGQNPDSDMSKDVPLTGINLGSNDPLRVTLTLNGTTLTETVVDTVTNAMFSHTYTLNIGQVIGSGPALVGFTGGTGGETAIQRINSWSGTFIGPTSAIQLTDNRGGEATSVFYNSPIGVGPFSTSFTLQDTPHDGADSLSFVIQSDPRGLAALGGSGGAGGYGGITNSIAVKFDLWNHGNHEPYSTGLFTGGQNPDSDTSKDVSLAPIALGSGHPLQITFVYDGTTLMEMVRDTVTGQTFSHNYPLNLAQVIGGNSAYVGFTAGTGGVASTQSILNWSGTFSPAQPTRLLVTAPSTIPAGTPFQVTVTAVDQNNNALTGYRGVIHFTSSDPAAGLPANYSFAAADQGTHTFTITLNSVGSQSITAVDTATASITGSKSGINVTWDFSVGFVNNSVLQANGSAAFVGPVAANPVGMFAGHQNIGTATDPGTPGGATFSNGAYTLTASGSDIWGNGDNFHYLYESLVGDGEIIARLVSANAPDFWTKAGLMIRTDLSAGSANEFMLDTPNTGHQEPVLQWRDAPGNGSGDSGNHGTSTTPNVPVPIWLRLVRQGNHFIGFWATDNNGTPNTWQQLAAHDTTMPTTVYVGLGLTAHNNGATATATFDHVQVLGLTGTSAQPVVARLTDGGNSEAGSIFGKAKLPTTAFTTSFVLRDLPINAGGADSLSFVLQNDPRGAAALGGGGGDGGYGGIANSIAIKFDLWTDGTHAPATGLFLNGQSPHSHNTQDVAITGGINLLSGDPIQVTLTYNGTTLTLAMRDTVTGQSFTYDWLVNLAQVLGGTSAYAGFTAGTGGASAVQDIQSWTYTPTAVPAVASLSASLAITSPNLVTNGGFETGDFTGWTLSGFGAGDDNVVTGPAGSAEIHGGTHAGQFGPGSLGTLSQTLTTTPGVSYNLDFWLSNPIGGDGTEWLVRVGGNTLIDVHNAPTFNFRHFTFTFTATSASTVLQFGFAHPPDWWYLDDVSVTPANFVAGTSAQLTVTALDAGGHRVGYTGTVHFTSSDAQAVLPANYTFTAADAGQHAFPVTLKTAGSQTVTATDLTNSGLTASATVTVNPAAASTVMVSGFPSPVTAGTAGTFSVTIKDAFGNVVTGYRGTVHFTSTDMRAMLPADYTFTAADAGTHVFTATLKTAGSQSITATDTTTASLTGTQSGITVTPAAVSVLAVSANPPTVTAGMPVMLTVTAQDAYGNTVTSYGGTIHFTSTDPRMLLPADYTFTAADMGVHTFTVTPTTAGTQTITVQDAANHITSSATITVNPAATAALRVQAPASTSAGQAFVIQVTAVDGFGNTTPGYTGTVHFSSSDLQAALPADYTFTAANNGQASFVVTLFTAGNQTITATDTTTASITGTATVTVNPLAAVALVVGGFPSPVQAGTEGSFTVTAVDQYGNVATSYTGTVAFFSTDPQASLPDNYTFTAADAGTHVFTATLFTAGTQVLGAYDINDPSVAGGEQDGIVVTPAPVAAFSVTGFPSPVAAGTPGTFTVTAVDAYGNTVTNFADRVSFYSSDSKASLPRSYQFTLGDHGTHTFTATLYTAGSQSIGAIDVNNPSIVGTQDGIQVTPLEASALVVSGFPSPIQAGMSGQFSVTAVDQYGNVATDYAGTITFYSSDMDAQLPADYTFTAADGGTHVFTATLFTPGTQNIGAFDVDTAIFGEQDNIEVDAPPALRQGKTDLANALAQRLVVDHGSTAAPQAAEVTMIPAASTPHSVLVLSTSANTDPTLAASDRLEARLEAVDQVLANWDGGLLRDDTL